MIIIQGPVVRVKQGLTKLKNECTQMEIQIGLVSYYNYYHHVYSVTTFVDIIIIIT